MSSTSWTRLGVVLVFLATGARAFRAGKFKARPSDQSNSGVSSLLGVLQEKLAAIECTDSGSECKALKDACNASGTEVPADPQKRLEKLKGCSNAIKQFKKVVQQKGDKQFDDNVKYITPLTELLSLLQQLSERAPMDTSFSEDTKKAQTALIDEVDSSEGLQGTIEHLKGPPSALQVSENPQDSSAQSGWGWSWHWPWQLAANPGMHEEHPLQEQHRDAPSDHSAPEAEAASQNVASSAIEETNEEDAAEEDGKDDVQDSEADGETTQTQTDGDADEEAEEESDSATSPQATSFLQESNSPQSQKSKHSMATATVQQDETGEAGPQSLPGGSSFLEVSKKGSRRTKLDTTSEHSHRHGAHFVSAAALEERALAMELSSELGSNKHSSSRATAVHEDISTPENEEPGSTDDKEDHEDGKDENGDH